MSLNSKTRDKISGYVIRLPRYYRAKSSP